ncbi:MAG: efflux RND transporter periplasmic adaptor subunit [Patescibacteria group bacterium]
MKKHANTALSFIKSHYILFGIGALVVAGIAYSASGGNGIKAELYTVKTADVIQKVIVNGKTKPVDSVELAFEANGTVRSVSVNVGSRVVAGQVLVTLDQSRVYADLLKAQANVASENARLDEIKTGTRPEEIQIAKTEVTNAELLLSDARNNISTKLTDAYSKSDDAVKNIADQFFSNPRSDSPQFNLSTPRAGLKEELNVGRVQMGNLLDVWANVSTDTSAVAVAKAEQNLLAVSSFMDKIAEAINSQTESNNLSQATITSYKTSVATTRSSLNSTLGAIVTAKEKLNAAQSALTVAQNNLSLKENGSTPQAVKAQEAKVLQAIADVEYKKTEIAKMTLRSPQSGIVTIRDVSPGEIVSAGKPVISVISDNNLELESNVSEISIAKVSVGDKVAVSFDAFPGELFSGTVTYIEPAETIIDGVVNYKVTVAFSEKYPQMKSGLTSKLEIITEEKAGVLVVPQYSVITEGEETFVLKQSGEEFVKTKVMLGLKGQDGTVEVLSGLAAGDVINMSVSK